MISEPCSTVWHAHRHRAQTLFFVWEETELPPLVGKCVLYSCWACQTCSATINGILTVTTNYCCSDIIVWRTQWVIAGVLAPVRVSGLENECRAEISDEWHNSMFLSSCPENGPSGSVAITLCSCVGMNTCIVARPWHSMTLCCKFKQPEAPPTADAIVAAGRVKQGLHGQRSVSVGVRAFMAGPLLTQGETVRGGNCLQHSFFPSVRRFFPVSSRCPWKKS